MPDISLASADSGENVRSIEEYAGVQGYVDGIPIYAFGSTFVYGVSPDFETKVVVQEGNTRGQPKIRPKKSWEIGDNRIGFHHNIPPHTPRNEMQPFLCINLIDGNRDTVWVSREQPQPDYEPVWIRLDLARETDARKIVLVPKSDGQGIPSRLTVKVSRDSWHWTTTRETDDLDPLKNGEPLSIQLAGVSLVKQVWITGNDLPHIRLTPGQNSGGHSFCLAEVQVIDERGDNVALASRGAGVTVSSTDYGEVNEPGLIDALWPTNYDVGVKLIRPGCWTGDPLLWHFVEREKGKYVIDEKADRCITEAVNNGVRVVKTLAYGNWLYAPQPKDNFAGFKWVLPYHTPPGPSNPEAREGFANYVRFIVKHFKGRIAYYEIWNEPDLWPTWPPDGATSKEYCDLVKEIAPIIRETDPEAKVMFGGSSCTPGTPQPDTPTSSSWLYECLEQGIAPLVDVLAWHSFYSYSSISNPESLYYRDYPRYVREFQTAAEAHGFKGEYMCIENWLGAPYPKPSPNTLSWPFYTDLTEIQKAKDSARIFTMNLGLGVSPFWCGSIRSQFWDDAGLFRLSFSSDPVNQQTAEPAYYVLRILCTIMDGAEPVEVEVEFSDTSEEIDCYGFSTPGDGLLVGLWLAGKSRDAHPGVKTDVTIENVKASAAVGIDVLNGFEQELDFRLVPKGLVIPGLLIRDYPVMLRFHDREGSDAL